MRKCKPKLNEHVRKLVKARDLAQLSRDLGIPRTWLLQYARGGIQSPSCDRIETIYTALTGKELAI